MVARAAQNDAKLLERLANERRQVLNGVVTAIWELHTDSELAFAEGPMLLRTLGGESRLHVTHVARSSRCRAWC